MDGWMLRIINIRRWFAVRRFRFGIARWRSRIAAVQVDGCLGTRAAGRCGAHSVEVWWRLRRSFVLQRLTTDETKVATIVFLKV